jgi:hypothetical protein
MSFPWKRESSIDTIKRHGFPASCAGQALLEFTPYLILGRNDQPENFHHSEVAKQLWGISIKRLTKKF